MNADDPTLRAAGYVRVSTEEQAKEGYSLGVQRAKIEERAVAEGWELVEVYEDAAWSGRRDDRPRYQQMLDAAAAGAFDVLVIWKRDRFGRNLQERVNASAALARAKVRIVSLTEADIDADDPMSPVYEGLSAGVAEMESRLIGQRAKANLRARAENGKPNGGPRPYGLRYLDGRLVAVPGERPVVARIYAEFVAGKSQRQITRDLIADGIPALRGKWHQGTVSRILANPIYCGRVRFNGDVYPGDSEAIEAIVSEETWDQAARLRDALARTKGGGRGRPSSGSHLFVRGSLRCGGCGEAMVPRTIRARSENGRAYEAYFCYGRVRGGSNACDQTPAKREEVDSAVFDYFRSVALDVEETREHLTRERDRALVEAPGTARGRRARRAAGRRQPRPCAARLRRGPDQRGGVALPAHGARARA